jgi:hypothetical protein
MLYVDGFQVALPPPIGTSSPLLSYLETLDPRTIDFIEVLEGADATVYGPGSDRGIVYVHTLSGHRPDPVAERMKLKVFYARGYFQAPVFREPDYDKKEIKNSPYPDQRSTIYWDGNIMTDDRGKANLQFFTSDGKINYSVFVLGLTTGGEILLGKGKIMAK